MGESQPPSLTYLPHTVTPLSQVSYSLMPTTLFCTSTSKLLDNPTHIYVSCSMSPMLLPFPCPHCLFVRLYIANSLKYNEIPKLPFSSFSHQNILCEPLLLFSTCKKGKLLVITRQFSLKRTCKGNAKVTWVTIELTCPMKPLLLS